MPIIKSAKDKMRKDKKKTALNANYRIKLKKEIGLIRKADGAKEKGKLLSGVFALIDKAAKKGVLHKNKADRLKSRVSKLLRKK